MATLLAIPLVFAPNTASAQTVVPLGSADYVIAISFDGLRGDAVPVLDATELPNFYRLQTDGAFTLNARTDHDYQSTLPNHVTMVTGRPVRGDDGHQASRNSAGETIHEQAGFYVSSMYDVALDAGLRTAMYASKSKFQEFDDSYPDKIGTYYYDSDIDNLVEKFVADMQLSPYHLSLVHIRQPDTEGHSSGWNLDPSSEYMLELRECDRLLGLILDLIDQSTALNDRTAVVVTSDHGGHGTGHGDKTNPDDYTIPFFVWGPGVQPGADLYAMNPDNRADPGTSNPGNDAAPQPIRDGDLGNLALDFLGLADIPGSVINTDSGPLAVNESSDGSPVARIDVDPSSGTAPLVVTFDASASFDADGTIVGYAWDFGDGAAATGVSAAHTYVNPGSYTITLTVTDDEGKTDDAVAGVLALSPTAPITVVFRDSVSPTAGYAGTRDTKLKSDAETTSFGSDDRLEVDGSPDYGVLLRWDLSSIPQGAQVDAASLILHGTNASSHEYHAYEVHRDWEEQEATWLQYATGQAWSVEGAAGSADRGSTPLARLASPGTGTQVIPLNADGLERLQYWIENPSLNFGFIIENYDDASDGFDFTSREAFSSSERPAMSVTYRPPLEGSPTADFTASPMGGDLPLTVSFDGSASSDDDGFIVSYDWDFGNGSTGNGPSVTHTYSDAATFLVTLTVTDNDGKIGSASTSIVVTDPREPVTVAFQDGVSPAPSYAGTRDTKIRSDRATRAFGSDPHLEIDGSPDYGGLLRWDLTDIPDGAEITDAAITLYGINGSRDAYGVYPVFREWVESAATWQNYRSGAAWSTSGARGAGDRGSTPLAHLSSPDTGPFTFALNADGLAVLQSWADGAAPNHGLLIENYDGAGDGFDFHSREHGTPSQRPLLQVTYLPPQTGSPSAAFTASPLSGDAPLTVSFDGSSSSDDGFISSYDWEFGDGSGFSGAATIHTYDDPGSYTASLTVTDDEGNTATASKTIVVRDPNVNTPPVATASASPNQGLAPLEVTLSASGSNDPDGSIASYDWTTGDGAVYSGETIQHTYSVPGTYTATVTVTDEDGAAATASAAVVVEDPTQPVTIVLQDGVAPTSTYSGTRDAKILTDDASANFGLDQELEVDGSPDKGVLLKWNLSSLPAGATVTGGSITLNVYNASGDTYHFYELLREWTETQTTWNHATSGMPWSAAGAQGPDDRGGTALATASSPGTGVQTLALNAAGIETLQRWVDDPTSNFGLVLANYSGASDGFDFYSREEGTASRRPRLSITYKPPAPGAPTADFTASPTSGDFPLDVAFDASASRDADGTIESYAWQFGDGAAGSGETTAHTYDDPGDYMVTLTVTDDEGKIGQASTTVTVTDPRQPVTVTFQDGVAPSVSYAGTRDAKIRSSDATTNYGTDDHLEVDGSPDYGVLLRWDISSIPAGANITEASVSLDVFNSSNDTYHFYELFRPWSEPSVTWRVFDTGLSWEGAGATGAGDRSTNVAGAAASPGSGSLNLPLGTAGIEAVQRWVDDPAANHGFLIENYADAGNGFDFHSREAGTLSSRPALTVTYMPPQQIDAVQHDAAVATSLDESTQSLPETFGVDSVYPNPFNPTTTIRLNIPREGRCTVQTYNLIGQLLQSIELDARPGQIETRVDLSGFSSGTYFIVATGPSGTVSTTAVSLAK